MPSPERRTPAPHLNGALLSLSRAAALLGVHPLTLRRWANQGEIAVHRTPGGHRRFTAEDLQAFAARRQRVQAAGGLERLWAGQAIEETQRELADRRSAPQWLEDFDPATRAEHRRLGQELLALTQQYLRAGADRAPLLRRARSIGRRYAEGFHTQGLSLTRALRILIFFRDHMLDAALRLPEAAAVRTDAARALFRRLNQVLNAIEIGLAEHYDRAGPPGGARA